MLYPSTTLVYVTYIYCIFCLNVCINLGLLTQLVKILGCHSEGSGSSPNGGLLKLG